MTPSTVERLLIAIIHQQDTEATLKALQTLKLPLVHLASTGGFLERKNSTLLIGILLDQEAAITEILQTTCRKREEYMTVALEDPTLPMPSVFPVLLGGATLFSLPVERYEEF